RRAGYRNSSRAPCANHGQVKIRTVANAESRLRSNYDQVHGFLSNEAAVSFWLGRHVDVWCFAFLRAAGLLDEVCCLAVSRRLCSNPVAGYGHGDAGTGNTIVFDGLTGRDAGPHLSRIAGETDLRSARADWLWWAVSSGQWA